MKHIKLFENFSEKDWRDKILNETNLLDILYDLKEVSLEYLDVRHKMTNEFGDEKIIDKELLFMVDLHNKDILYVGNLFGGNYKIDNTDIENNLVWSSDITAPVEEVIKGLKSGFYYFNITFIIGVGETGSDFTAINSDTSEVYSRISDMYPEVEFETFNPWDLN